VHIRDLRVGWRTTSRLFVPNTKAKSAICVPLAPVGNEEDSAQQFVSVQAGTCRFG
jgi:hypothetical protein